MRIPGLLCSLLVVACTSSTSSTHPSPLVPEVPDRVDTLPCHGSVADQCANCDLTLDAALADQRLCKPGFAGLEACDDFDVVTKGEIDTATEYYYRDGQLSAVLLVGIPFGTSCSAGPQSFEAPHCNHEHAIQTPACAATP